MYGGHHTTKISAAQPCESITKKNLLSGWWNFFAPVQAWTWVESFTLSGETSTPMVLERTFLIHIVVEERGSPERTMVRVAEFEE